MVYVKKAMFLLCMTMAIVLSCAVHAEISSCDHAVVGALKSCNSPFCVMGSNGIPVGLDADILNEVLVGSSAQIQFRFYPTLPALRDAFSSGEVNVIAHVASHVTKVSAWLSSPYAYQRIVLVSKSKNSEFSDYAHGGSEIAISGSLFLLDYFSKAYPKAKIKYFESVLHGVQAVASGKLTALVTLESMAQSARDELLSRRDELYIHSLLVPQLSGERYSIPVRFAVSPRCKKLQYMIQRGLDAISTDRLAQIQSKWLTKREGVRGRFISSIDKQWLDRHGPIRVGLRSEPIPYDRIDGQGRWVGVAASLLTPFFGNLNIPYEVILLPPNVDAVHAMYASDLDMVVAVPYQPQIFDGTVISIPYDTIAWGVVRPAKRKETGVLATQLDHFRAVSYRDFQAPGKLLGTETTAQSLQAVLSGKADAAAVSVEAASEYLLSNYAGKLYLDEHVKGEEKLVFIIAPHAKSLAKVLNRYISSQSPDFLDRLHKYQHSIYIKQGYELTDVLWYLSIPALLVVVVVAALLWINYRVAGFRDKARQDAVQAMRQYTLAELESKNKTDFLAAIGHEVRTPMTGVLGALNLLKHSALTSEQKRQLDIAARSTELLQGKLNELLDFSKLESGAVVLKSELINLARVVDCAVALFQAEARRKQLGLFSFCEPGKNYYCYGDEACIMQMVSNLVSNAVKFTDAGDVMVCTEFMAEGQFKLTVTDTGKGMAESFQNKLFTFYSQENPEAGVGLGLGLAITKKLIGKMGGEITVSSEPGVGTQFVVQLSLPSTVQHEECTDREFVSLEGCRVWLDIRHETIQRYVEKWLSYFNAAIVSSPPADVAVSDVSDIVILGRKALLISRSEFDCFRLVETIARSMDKFERAPGVCFSLGGIKVGAGKRVLLVDDNDICRNIIQEQLALVGFAVHAVANGSAAISAWREGSFDLTLMDLRLVDMCGYQLAREIRKTDNWMQKPCPFWILSACSERDEHERYVAEGIAGFIQKPCTTEKLAELLSSEV
ncbi:hypothetical protein CR207_08685 [Chromobacterium violaceum]|nr:hypothetical protein CRN81_08665 [Chromobacterium violaceum]ATP32376.1 hypothetical protein CR207_08685 [Chromobacterium violaceum]